ncbi:hypothetical protein F0344_18970 [Streptomyces finlayi]|uniref:Uncharacterized protein n=1 Tax=Streptomyces finlayi TaxID=67296 RepID=A0A7G7BM65_9ACTN|nr:hypothetical protein [Streptomyces finlayi]QNE76430.1 hypothetical protein F0344_18970 [Streptomyces finlayi]
MDTRREAVTGTAGCLAAALGALVGLTAWVPYGRHGIFGGFEGASELNVLWLGLPVMLFGGTAAGLVLFALVRGKWRQAVVPALALTALTAVGCGFDVLAGPPLACGPGC